VKPALAFALLLAVATVIGLVLWLSTSSGADAQASQPTPAERDDASGEPRVREVDAPLAAASGSAPSAPPEREARGVAANAPQRGPTGSLLVRATWGSTGKPAANIQVCVTPLGGTLVHAVRSRTDASGAALFESVGAGLIFASGDRSGRTEPLWIEAGSRAETELVLESGLTVTGRVTTADGRSVSNAQIWVRSFQEWFALTEADASGRFRVEEIAPGSRLIATARELAPSREASANGAAGESVTLDLELGPTATSVLGQVLDPEERIVNKAVVLLEYGSFGVSGDGARWSTACDAEGRFAFHSVPPGECKLVVHSADFAPAVLQQAVVLGERQELIVRLEPGAELAGVVRLAGKPVAGAMVLVGRPSSYFEFWGGAISDAQGRYRIAGLPPSTQIVTAGLPAGSQEWREWTDALRSDGISAAEAKVELVAGRTVIWNAELKRDE
jgi:hypothetical protein